MVADYTGTNKMSVLVHQKGTKILGGQLKSYFLSNVTIFYTVNLYFGANLKICSCVATGWFAHKHHPPPLIWSLNCLDPSRF